MYNIITVQSTALFVERCSQNIPPYLGFERATLLIKGKESKDSFYTIYRDTGSIAMEDELPNDEIFKYSINGGISIKAIVEGSIEFEEELRTSKIYDPIFDNIGGGYVYNIAIACLYGPDSEPVGILQLYNKKDHTWRQEDAEHIAKLQQIIGCFLYHINESNEANLLLLRIKKGVNAIKNMA